MITRRLILASAVALLAPVVPAAAQDPDAPRALYGVIGQIVAKPGMREDLIVLFRDGMDAFEGCLGFVVAVDPADADAIWLTEVWEAKAARDFSLTTLMTQAQPLIARMGAQTLTEPLGGIGLSPSRRATDEGM